MSEVPAQLADYRRTIDNIDAALVHVLAERFRCTQKVGVLKAELGLPKTNVRFDEWKSAGTLASA